MLQIAGKPSKVLEGETTGEGGLINKAGKYEIWIYRGSALVFSEDKLVNKVRKGRHQGLHSKQTKALSISLSTAHPKPPKPVFFLLSMTG